MLLELQLIFAYCLGQFQKSSHGRRCERGIRLIRVIREDQFNLVIVDRMARRLATMTKAKRIHTDSADQSEGRLNSMKPARGSLKKSVAVLLSSAHAHPPDQLIRFIRVDLLLCCCCCCCCAVAVAADVNGSSGACGGLLSHPTESRIAARPAEHLERVT